MDAEEARRKNVEKQKRFQARHKERLAHEARKRELQRQLDEPFTRVQCGNFVVFQLSDPRDENHFPRYIGVTLPGAELWARLWAVRNISRGPWAKWLRSLDAIDLRPVVQNTIGTVAPLHWRQARAIVRMMANHYLQWGMPVWARWPRWLTTNVAANVIPVGCLYRSGHRRHWRTLQKAQRRFRNHQIMQAAHVVGRDKQGRLWFED